MDTKLKNRHKLAVVCIFLLIAIAASRVVSVYQSAYQESEEGREKEWKRTISSQEFLGAFVHTGYLLYGMEHRTDAGASIQEIKKDLGVYCPDFPLEFDALYPYLDYVITDGEGEILTDSADIGERITSAAFLDKYALVVQISYDTDGLTRAEVLQGDNVGKQTANLKAVINQEESGEVYEYLAEGSYEYLPEDRTFTYVMTESNLNRYLNQEAYLESEEADAVSYAAWFWIFLVTAAAIVLPFAKSFHTGEERIFRVPVEIPVLVCIVMLVTILDNVGAMVQRNNGYADFTDWLIWAILFFVVYWTAANVRDIFKLGVRAYVKERSLLVRSWGRIKGAVIACVNKVYRSFEKIDLEDRQNRFILKLVCVNFLILAVICTMWFYGITALVVYSVILFLILRKYFNDLKDKYRILLKATNELAEGNLDVEITEDLGVFRPFKAEIDKIQSGFKNAVQKEVKSQRMKTELITNVSHDLKTPLTAIITYVDLLKNESEEEKRKEYLDVLERKSLRLKVLIEDLFEISKANSENVTLNLVDVDIVHLFKQVKLELEDKIKASDLDFRCSYPDEKILVRLDSQKTYRIFENLLVNIIKYAMPHTRVYIEITQEEGHAVVRMKNISAQELNFNTDEITERFVRGDVSRNTEGSGLGLAIVKSFVELQKGVFKIETEADLFKVEIRF